MALSNIFCILLWSCHIGLGKWNVNTSDKYYLQDWPMETPRVGLFMFFFIPLAYVDKLGTFKTLCRNWQSHEMEEFGVPQRPIGKEK